MKLIEIVKTQPEKIAFAVLAAVSVVVAGFGLLAGIESVESKRVTIAAGPSRSESYVVMQAVKAVVERHYPRVRVTVLETRDTTDSLRRLERSEAQVAASQADAPAPPSARVVAVLFENVFQLLANKEANIHAFTDLKGKKIALAPNGAQFESFMFVAGHFGLASNDFTFVGTDDDTADVAFARKDADAIFRIRALHNAAIERMAQSGKVDLVPIGDAPAMHAQMPSYTQTVIPKGAYLGNPPIPSTDVETVALKQTLLARQDMDEDAIAAITQVLMERRPEMGAVIQSKDPTVLPLLAQIQQPTPSMGLGLALHPGAREQYDRWKPAFIQEHADLVAGLLLVFALLALWLWAMQRSGVRRQKQRLDQYLTRLAQIMDEVEDITIDRELSPLRAELMKLMKSALHDLQHDRISESTFRSLHLAWQTANDTLRERRAAIRSRPPAPPAAAAAAAASEAPALERPLWRVAKIFQK